LLLGRRRHSCLERAAARPLRRAADEERAHAGERRGPERAPAAGHWLGWGLALFILGASALFLDLDQVTSIPGRVDPAVVLGLLLLLTSSAS
jgi:hypothetical protein